MTINKKQAIAILANFGFKVYESRNETYFLQSVAKIKPMKKYSMEDMLKLLNPEQPKTVVDKVKKAVAPKNKKKVVKSDE